MHTIFSILPFGMIKKCTTIVSVSIYLYKKSPRCLSCSMFESEHVLCSRMNTPSGHEEVFFFQSPLRLFITAKMMFTLMSLSACSSKYDLFHIFNFMSFPPSGILGTHNGLLSSWLDSLKEWIERCVRSSRRTGFDS